jgi:LPS O-antigen subunit length determinant protein (WzzB/FepE family)
MQEDTIDIKELFNVLKKRKKLVGLLTALFTLLALLYVFMSKPVYEAKAVVELAQINKKPVQDLNDLKQKVEFLYEVNLKGKKIELPLVKSVEMPKKTSNIMIVKTHGYSNETATEKLQEVIDYITTLQNKELDSYGNIQKQRLELVTEDISRNEKLTISATKEIAQYKEKLFNISKQDAALAGIYAIEIGKKQTELNEITTKVYTLKNKKNDLELSVSPLKIQKTTTIGNIETLDKAVKPKKLLITIIAFITGLMLSIFLAFFLEFLQGMKEN